MIHLTIKQTLSSMTRGKKLVFGDPESIAIRDKAAAHYKKFKRSGMSEAEFYFTNELKYFLG